METITLPCTATLEIIRWEVQNANWVKNITQRSNVTKDYNNLLFPSLFGATPISYQNK